jgi:hypothetical protein
MRRKYLMTAASVAIASSLFGSLMSSPSSSAATLQFSIVNPGDAFTLIREGGGGGMRGGAMDRGGGTRGGGIGQRPGGRGGTIGQRGGTRGGAIGQHEGMRGRGIRGQGRVERDVMVRGRRGTSVRGGRTVIYEGRKGIRRKAFFRGGRWWYGRSCYTNCRDSGFGPGYCDRLGY